MGEIYVITNKINEKKYVGQTSYTTKIRWQQHVQDIWRYDYPLYRALRKYGVENFEIECLEECRNEELNTREIYYIEKYDAYTSGYNCTLGGEGRKIEFDKEEVIRLWTLGYSISHVSNTVGIYPEAIRLFLYSQGISKEEVLKRSYTYKQKKTCQIDYHSREIVRVHDSVVAAANFLGGDRSSVSAVCFGTIPFAYGFVWRFWDEISEEDKAWMMYSGELPDRPPYYNFMVEGRKRKVKRLCGNTRLYLDCYESVTEAGREVHCSESSIRKAISTGGISAGYCWEYCNEDCATCDRDKAPVEPSPILRGKKVIQLDEDGNYLACYLSLSDASRHMVGYKGSVALHQALKGGRETAHGYKWEMCTVDCNDCQY